MRLFKKKETIVKVDEDLQKSLKKLKREEKWVKYADYVINTLKKKVPSHLLRPFDHALKHIDNLAKSDSISDKAKAAEEANNLARRLNFRFQF